MGFGLRKERVLGSSADAKSTAELWSLPTGPKEFPRFRIPCADLTRSTASRANVRRMSGSNNTPIHVRWWVLEDSRSVAALMPGRHHCGIYILEFENNERYVGQARDVVRRYQSHRHGSKHHVAWRDIVGFGFIEVPPSDLDRVEREIIAQQRGRYHLRNRMWNLENTEPRPLDNIVSIVEQKHWANGHPQYGEATIEEIRIEADREPGPTPKLLTASRGQVILPGGKAVADVVIDELANIIESVIPSPVSTEKTFWTLSDFPQTSGGRFATLNVGPLEIAYFPRYPIPLSAGGSSTSGKPGLVRVVNSAPGSFFAADSDSYAATFGESRRVATAHRNVRFDAIRATYPLTPVDQIISKLGTLDLRLLAPSQLQGVRRLAIAVMRNKSASLNRRHHSSELTRLVFQRIVERHDLNVSTGHGSLERRGRAVRRNASARSRS